MDICKFPLKIQKYILELMKREAISSNSLEDKMFINYLFNLMIDEDFINSRVKV